MSYSLFLLCCVEVTLYFLAVILVLPVGVLAVECMAALVLSRQKQRFSRPCVSPQVAILIPAHNEAEVIGQTLESLWPQLKQGDRLIVIADNCSDQTAKIARQQGATVLERQNSVHVGKGYALDYGLRFLAATAPDVVVMIDADCIVQQGTIATLTHWALATERPIQGAYVMVPPICATPKDLISAFAFKVKNLVRPMGLTQLSLPCLLTGSGMALPWCALQQINLANGHIVEDMKLGLDLAIAGYPPLFCPDARIISRLPENRLGAKQQRIRWEHGHLQVLLEYIPLILKATVQQQRFDLLAIAFDLCIPPLSLLVILWLLVTLGIAVALLAGASWALFFSLLMLIMGLVLLGTVLTSWLKFARADLSLGQLLLVPLYVFGKAPLYVSFLTHPQTRWQKTRRDPIRSTSEIG